MTVIVVCSIFLLFLQEIHSTGRAETAMDDITTHSPNATSNGQPSLRRVASSGSPSCMPMSGGSAINLFYWTEGDSLQPTFFQKLISFVDSNCANAKLVRLVIRMTSPRSQWLPGKASPFYSQFLTALQSRGLTVDLVLFPYFMDSSTRASWVAYGGVSSPLEGAVIFMKKWNSFMSGAGIKNTFSGMVIDYEENPTWTGSSPMDIAKGTIDRLKSKHGSFQFGLTIGYDDVTKFSKFSYVDKFYLQIYDLYTPKGVTKTKDSRFYLYRDNPSMLVQYMKDSIFTNTIKSAYADNKSKIYAMWSLQTPDDLCVYPNGSGVCDGNYEFGSWSGGRFHEFIKGVQSAVPVLAGVDHGLYYFGLTPKSWLSR